MSDQSTSEPSPDADSASQESPIPDSSPDAPDAGHPGTGAVPDGEYAQGQTADPAGAEREEPAGEDYAGSGF